METDNNKQEPNNNTKQTNPPPGLNGPDLSGFFTEQTWEWLKPLLSGAGAMTGTYFLWIKPMQEKIDAMTTKINEQEKQIIRLEHEVDDLGKEFARAATKKEESNDNVKGIKDDYFEIRNRSQQSEGHRKHRNFKI